MVQYFQCWKLSMPRTSKFFTERMTLCNDSLTKALICIAQWQFLSSHSNRFLYMIEVLIKKTSIFLLCVQPICSKMMRGSVTAKTVNCQEFTETKKAREKQHEHNLKCFVSSFTMISIIYVLDSYCLLMILLKRWCSFPYLSWIIAPDAMLMR